MSSLISGFSGRLIDRKDPAYDDVRRVHNGLIDKRPALIARCLGAVDAVDALAHARTNGLPVAIRGGGHNVAGRGLVDDGVVIDLSLMRGVHVDRKARTALAQGGATWGGFNRETQAHGLATTGGVVSTTGVAGLTLGGGIGYLMGRHGLSIDNLESVEIVTADGRILTASATDEPDLFWALRGGGGNFGVVTSFLFRLHPVGPVVTGGIIAYPLDKAIDVLRFYREVNASAPEDLTIFGGLVHAPDGSKLVALVCGHCGARADGEAVMAPIKRFGSPVMDTIGPMTYEALNMLFDAPNPPGALNYWKSSYLDDLSDEAIRTMADRFEREPTAMSAVLLEFMHGKAASVGPIMSPPR